MCFMQKFYTSDPFLIVLGYLAKNDLFNFASTHKNNRLSNYNYEKHKFIYEKIKNESLDYKKNIKYIVHDNSSNINNICNEFPYLLGLYEVTYDPNFELSDPQINLIRSLNFNCDKIDSLVNYKNLETIKIKSENFNDSLDSLPQTITEIRIDSKMFNREITTSFAKLKKLVIKGASFNSQISEQLIENLSILKINSPCFSKIDPKKNNSKIKISSLMFGITLPLSYHCEGNVNDTITDILVY